MSPGYHTQNLVSMWVKRYDDDGDDQWWDSNLQVSELYRITDTVSKQIPSTSSNTFAWLAKYKSTGDRSYAYDAPA